MVSVTQQQPLESAEAFAAFNVYLSLGPERSLAKTAGKVGKGRRVLEGWSVRFNWVRRVALHEAGAGLAGSKPSSPASTIAAVEQQPPRADSDASAAASAAGNASSATSSTAPGCNRGVALQQLPTESNKAYGAFKAYVALGTERSLSKAAAALGRSRDVLAEWSTEHKWVSRIAAHEAHLACIEQEAAEDVVREKSRDWAQTHEGIRRQAWAEAEDLIALAQELKARWRNCDRVPEFGALLRALELAFKLKQFAAGMPNEVKQVNATVSGVNGGPVRLQFEAALKKIYGRPLPGEVVDVEPLPATPS